MRIRLLGAALLLLGAGAGPGAAGEGGGTAATAPADNSAYVPTDREGVLRDDAAARAALAAGDVVAAARALQRVAEGPPEAVLPAGEPGLAEGVERGAHLRVAAGGAALLAAYEREYGATAAEAFAAATGRRDEAALARLVARWRPARAAREATFLLADLAAERGDEDRAREALDGLEDLEEVAPADLAEEAAAWRARRLDRLAALLAKDDAAIPRVRARLASARGGPLRPTEAIPVADRRLPPEDPDWPTSGGDASRARVVPPLGAKLRFASVEPFYASPLPSPFTTEENPLPRPSLWLPTRGVVAGGRIWVSDGRGLRVFDVETGTYATASFPYGPHRDPGSRPPSAGRPARRRYGWIEGHGLTVDGTRIYVNLPADTPVDDPSVSPEEAAFATGRGPRIAAFDLVDARLVPRWEAGGGVAAPGLPEGLRLHGPPLLYRGSVHVAGIRETAASDERIECWHVRLDADSGAVQSATFLGSGSPVRRGRPGEAIPAACAAAHGRVVVLTSLGLLAAVDATSGRTVWSLRYDRGRPDGDDLGRRLDDARESSDRRSSFANEPPLLADGRCFVAPTDSRHLLATADRPRGAGRVLRLWRRDRVEDFRNLAVEQLVGVVGEAFADAPVLVVVGKGHETDGSPHTAVVGLDPATGGLRWERPLPEGGAPEPYGRAALTAGEVYVPTIVGVARYRVADGADLPPLVRESEPPAVADLLSESDRLTGNLLPIPGRGLVAIEPNGVTIWRR